MFGSVNIAPLPLEQVILLVFALLLSFFFISITEFRVTLRPAFIKCRQAAQSINKAEFCKKKKYFFIVFVVDLFPLLLTNAQEGTDNHSFFFCS